MCNCRSVVKVFVFFFQAEDGIRDGTVTGVQTCALPISACQAARARLEPEFSVDVKSLEASSELSCSLHASKTMRLLVPDVQEISRRLTALAAELRGRYDGWAA